MVLCDGTENRMPPRYVVCHIQIYLCLMILLHFYCVTGYPGKSKVSLYFDEEDTITASIQTPEETYLIEVSIVLCFSVYFCSKDVDRRWYEYLHMCYLALSKHMLQV